MRLKLSLWFRRLLSRCIQTFVNLVDWILRLVGIILCPLTAESILQDLPPDVQNEATHSDLAEPFQLFLEDVRGQNVHLLSRISYKMYWKKCLSLRPSIAHTLAYFPDITETPIYKPIFLIGLNRSGTTLLQRLMALDDRLFTPMLWELDNPLPQFQDGVPIEKPGRMENYKSSQRFRITKATTDAMRYTMPDFMSVHHMEPQTPDECFLLLMVSPLSPILAFHLKRHHLQRSRDWLISLKEEHLRETYRVYRQLVQIIGYKDLNKKRFLSKAPIHLFGLDVLMETFPDAKFIFSHRRLTEIVPSYIRMEQAQYGMSIGNDIRKTLTERCVHFFSTLASRYVDIAAKYDNSDQNPFFNYSYVEMMRDPIAIVRKVYGHIEMDLPTELEERMREYLSNKPQHHHGKVTYSMDMYGLTKQGLERDFQTFINYFVSKGESKEDLI